MSEENVHVPPSPAEVSMMGLKERLTQYITEMKPGRPIDSKHGAVMQTTLWNAIRFVLGHDGSTFVALYSELLKTIAEHRRGVFDERYVYRFFSDLRMSSPERRNFERMLNLLLCTCDPRTRHLGLKQVSLRSVLAGLDSKVQERVAGYYQL